MFDKEYDFYGKHADMVLRLTNSFDRDNNIGSVIKTNMDVYEIAPILGYLYNRKAKIDKSTNSMTKIFRDKMMDDKYYNTATFRMLMMLIDKDTKSNDERKEIAFKLDDNDEKRKEYDDIYNDYVRGGVEVLYEKVFGDGNTEDEVIMSIYEFLEDYNDRYYADEIREL
jgi:hypothetical protein